MVSVKDVEDWLLREERRVIKREQESQDLQEKASLRGSRMTTLKLLDWIRTKKSRKRRSDDVGVDV